MRKLIYFPYLILPSIYGLYQIDNLSQVTSIEAADAKFMQLVYISISVLVTGLLQAFALEVYHRYRTRIFRNWLAYNKRSKIHLQTMKQPKYQQHAANWGIKDMEAPHYTK